MLLRTVYPRVGGGTHKVIYRNTPPVGLSPRGRGNHAGAADDVDFSRSIPAWAGEPGERATRAKEQGVYPRVGGGTSSVGRMAVTGMGLSPRGRGNQPFSHRDGRTGRSIPAWAGEPRPRGSRGSSRWVYPRVGGGTQVPASMMPGLIGLSPRGRGNRAGDMAPWSWSRSIPAWAGEPAAGDRWRGRAGVYPRVGGGTNLAYLARYVASGLSPRGRGNLPFGDLLVPEGGSIPAWAGEPHRP